MTGAPLPSPLTLGTVQLGLPYGSVVKTEPPGQESANRVFDAAWNGGITSFDTAAAYGEAEAQLGTWVQARGYQPFVTTKIAKSAPADGEALRDTVRRQAAALGSSPLDALLVHDPAQLTPELGRELQTLSESGVIRRFGASVYDPDEAGRALDTPGLSVLQVPLSLADARFADAGVLDRCRRAGVLVFTRSLFLQGVLLADPGVIPEVLSDLRVAVTKFRALAREADVAPMALCLAAGRLPGITSAIVGVANPDQLAANLAAFEAPFDAGLVAEAMALFAGLDRGQTDPRQWPA